jgi:predicted membrane-bound spermidine synthase
VALPIALLLFFMSGFAALLYQVIWQRLLTIFSGVDLYSATIIVAAFMAGLGFGSLVGGHLADRLGPRASVWAFAVAELLIGLFGVISKPLYYDVLYVQFPHLAGSPGTAAAILFAALLWPTFCMGLSLPLLARGLTDTLGGTGRVVGSLYGWNTLGAAAGAFVSTWVLLPRFGLEQTVWLGAALNIACAAGAALLAGRNAAPAGETWRLEDRDDSATVAIAAGPGLSFRRWAIVYGLTGFIALALEMLWFRMLGVMLKSTAFTFGTLLGLYLSGLGFGAAIGARAVGRSRRPGATFLLMQYGLTLYAACSVIALVALVAAGHPIKLVRHLGGNEPVDVYATVALLRSFSLENSGALQPFFEFLVLYIVIPGILIGPATFLMGLSFPYLQKATHADFARLGRRVGVLLAANITGSMLGAMAAGWLLLPRLGTAGTLDVLVALGVFLSAPYGRLRWPGRRGAAWATLTAALVVTGLVITLTPSGDALWARLHATTPRRVIVGEDGSGLSLLKTDHGDFRAAVTVFVNGLSQSWIPYGNIHTALGALPALIHPAPADVVIIGLGSGDTAFSAAGRPEVKRLVCVELIGAQIETLETLARIQAYPGLVRLLTDSRIEHRVGDGRAYILQGSRRFDIIEADALRPTSAYSGNLYSREYFELLARRLQPGGFAVTWAPTERIRRTFVKVFPHVLAFGDIYIGSNDKIEFDAATVTERAAAVRPYYREAGIDIDAVIQPYLTSVPQSFGPDYDRAALDDLNTDTFPRDEFALPF